MKRAVDVVIAATGLAIALPLLAALAVAVVAQDGGSPLYIARRIGRHGRPFRMLKMRSMVAGADRTQVDSTANDDRRITPVGRVMRLFKLDELPQLWNVLVGDMSLVGPRPNVEREVRLYSEQERHILDVRPGITDLSSIVFADYGAILEGQADPDIAYNQLIRPYKSRLALLYVQARRSVVLDLRLLLLTVANVVHRQWTLERTARLVVSLGGSPDLAAVARRQTRLAPAPPPGLTAIVTSRTATDRTR
jgi:lipopolysaccharide/colanic/teichoic acid biosynthesis glycosyltransferase